MVTTLPQTQDSVVRVTEWGSAQTKDSAVLLSEAVHKLKTVLLNGAVHKLKTVLLSEAVHRQKTVSCY